MRKLLAVLLLVFPFGLPASGQDEYPRVEIFGGYSYINLDTPEFFDDRPSANGWAASFSLNFNERFGLTGDFGWQVRDMLASFDTCPPGSLCIVGDIAFGVAEPQTNQILGGPRYTLRGDRFTGFAHILAGLQRTTIPAFSAIRVLDGSTVIAPETSKTDFALNFGGGLDWSVNDRWAVRVVQFDYLPVRTGGTGWAQNVRLQSGVVVKF
jgi:hypothetical protein